MAKKKAGLDRLDRVRRPSESAASATLIDDHKDGGFSVLPDVGPKQSVHWEQAVKVGGPIRTCARCNSQDHIAIYCKEQTNV